MSNQGERQKQAKQTQNKTITLTGMCLYRNWLSKIKPPWKILTGVKTDT